VNEEKALSFSIRISSSKNRITEDKTFMKTKEESYIKELLTHGESLVIAGATGSGKTELQKYLLNGLARNSRVIVIDNIQELESLRSNEELDLTYWQVSPNMPEKTFQSLIKNALRSNPDWLVISESRGKEMSDILLSVMSGHPVITTIHSYDLESTPNRLIRMVQLSEQDQSYEDIKNDIFTHLKNYIYLRRKVDNDGTVHRYIESIGKIENGEMKIIFNHGS
ncbi:MAG: Flp pilus assembly complex ATPase component TadA, partial [Bacilli bacterium]|nr:Flp pilus assembly complex ATPase component TadA [Bacilli bacterium]